MTAIFIDSPRFPDWISAWCTGGRNFNTIVAETYGGNEIRTAQWSQARGLWDCEAALSSNVMSSGYTYQTIRDFFMVSMGQLGGFRFKDFNDYKDDGYGQIGTGVNTIPAVYGVGAGYPSSQIYKNYSFGSETYRAVIYKLVASTFVLKVNSVVTVPLAVNMNVGTITYTALGSATINTTTVGATTVLHLTAVPATAANGKLIYVSGTSGTVGTALNGLVWTITNIAGNDITIAAVTTGLTGGVGGTAAMYYQATDTLTCTYEYDVPVRFAQDVMDMGLDTSGALQNWQQLKIIEIRNPS